MQKGYKCEKWGCKHTLPCPLHSARVNLRERTITIPGDDFALAARQAKALARIAKMLGEFLKLPGY